VSWKCACQWFISAPTTPSPYWALLPCFWSVLPWPWPSKSLVTARGQGIHILLQIGKGQEVAHWSDSESSLRLAELGQWLRLCPALGPRQASEPEFDQAVAADLALGAGPSGLFCHRDILQANYKSPSSSTANWLQSQIPTASALMAPPSLICTLFCLYSHLYNLI
jgi:hypothetical protein